MDNASTRTYADRPVPPPKPRYLLIPITDVLSIVHEISKKRISIPELVDALEECYDGDKMMLYDGTGPGLPTALDGFGSKEDSGYNQRADQICEVFNSHYWTSDPDKYSGNRITPYDTLISRTDAVTVATSLWEFFFPDTACPKDLPTRIATKTADEIVEPGAPPSGELGLSPDDLPEELYLANLAYRAVLNGYGVKEATFRNRVIDYLKTNFANLNKDTVDRIASVANPDKTRGRK